MRASHEGERPRFTICEEVLHPMVSVTCVRNFEPIIPGNGPASVIGSELGFETTSMRLRQNALRRLSPALGIVATSSSNSCTR